ncbi:NAD synthetase [Pseudomonas sp. FP2338]|uniref:NAD synthetase n=1 Tax=Pseudomonas sp. FP2338 TaxID=2954093 RepID=UPI002736E2A2|nr:NAD synthetase [Pseudomonas sp. FP2338]WLH82831.1 NAD synthetase [Pseudomonas sp. FP2338]
MTASLLKDGFPSAHRTTRQRIESSIDLRKLFFAIDSDPALIGAGVVYIDDMFNVVVLREFQTVCSVRPIKVVLREAPKYVGPAEFKRMLEHEPRESEWVAEALGTAVTCTGAILSWIVVTSGVMLMPFTAGTSAVITVIGQAATAAGTVQCIAGALRIASEAAFPEFNDYLDSEPWYQDATAVLDGVALLGVATSMLVTVKAIITTTQVTGKSIRQVLKGLTRQERAKLNNELLKIHDPRLTSRLLKLEKANGKLSKRISATQMQHATATHIMDVLAASLSFTSSATNGNLKTLAVGVYEEVNP